MGLGHLSNALLTALNAVRGVDRNGLAHRRDAHGEACRKFRSCAPWSQRYAAHYDGVSQQQPEKLSEKIGGFYERWSIKFTAEYYEAKERAEAAKGRAPA